MSEKLITINSTENYFKNTLSPRLFCEFWYATLCIVWLYAHYDRDLQSPGQQLENKDSSNHIQIFHSIFTCFRQIGNFRLGPRWLEQSATGVPTAKCKHQMLIAYATSGPSTPNLETGSLLKSIRSKKILEKKSRNLLSFLSTLPNC